MRSRELRRVRAAIGLLLALGALGLLRQGILVLRQEVPAIAVQAALIEDEAIEPASLFYTENPLALTAARRVRAQVELAPRE